MQVKLVYDIKKATSFLVARKDVAMFNLNLIKKNTFSGFLICWILLYNSWLKIYLAHWYRPIASFWVICSSS